MRAKHLAFAGACFWSAQSLAQADPAQSQTAQEPPASALAISVNPQRICFNDRSPSYLNFDFLVANRSAEELTISELRAMVLGQDGHVVERRLIWQQALQLLGPARTVAPGAEAVIFNPLLLNSATLGRTVRYEIDATSRNGSRHSARVTVTPVDCRNRHRLQLPVGGRVLVYDGYDFFSHHRRTGYGSRSLRALGITDNSQRFGLDLVVVDEAGRLFTGSGTRLEEWLGWGQSVHAAGSGIVAAVHDGQPDNDVIGELNNWTNRHLAANPMSSYGNYVLIEHAPGEFTVAAHLKNGSVRVARGQRVTAGQVIGAIGNSGASGGVHLHFERRTGPGLAGIQTLPPYFHGVQVFGARTRGAAVALDTGDVVVARR